MTAKDYNGCVDRYADGLYRYVVSMCHDKDLAHDIVQDTFEKLWIKRHDVSGSKAKSYMFTTAHHRLIDHLRKRKRESDIDSAAFDRGYDPGFNDLQEVLHEALSRLNPVQQSVLLLRDYEGYSYEEIGAITDLSDAQVKVYIYRARVAMKRYLVSIDTVL